jgi:dipeptidyl aminopeptidase/acylaminoacyl peptidase
MLFTINGPANVTFRKISNTNSLLKAASLLLFFLGCITVTDAQSPLISKKNKPAIDSMAIVTWANPGTELQISSNGKYFLYNIENQPVNSQTLVIQATAGSWKKEFPGAAAAFFTNNSKQVIFFRGDTLYQWRLGAGTDNYVPGVSGFKKYQAHNHEWLAYTLNSPGGELVLRNLETGNERRFNNTLDYTFIDKGNGLLLKQQHDTAASGLKWINLKDNSITVVWWSDSPGTTLNSYVTDNSGTQLLLLVQQDNGAGKENAIWYFKPGMSRAMPQVTNATRGIQPGYTIQAASPRFSEDGQYTLFTLAPPPAPKPKPGAVKVDVWNYRDPLLQCTQLFTDPESYTAAIGLNNDTVICLEQEYEKIITYPIRGGYVVVKHEIPNDRYWESDSSKYQATYWLVSLKDGSRKQLNGKGSYQFYYFSPSGNYLVYYDAEAADYFSYNLHTGKTVNISAAVPDGLLNMQFDYTRKSANNKLSFPAVPVDIAGWLKDDAGLLVYDNYDIWKLDLTGDRPAVNITNGYGQANHIKFRLVYETDFWYKEILHDGKDPLLLTAFNPATKENGFYHARLKKKGNPRQLTMGPYTYFCYIGKQVTVDHEYDPGMKPLKAANANTWIVKRQSAVEAPNYWVTKDFKHYRPLTNLQPQKAYNWLTAELVSWQQLDGTMSQGVLYKPENFDPGKKYPVLFNYYQQLSGRLYQFPRAGFTGSNINVPWFVSRGYLVFTPDIYYTPGDPGKSVYNTMVSAAQWLAKLPYVDAAHMGINGHSTGGGETNYLVSHTGIFAAALEGAGVADNISAALQLSGIRGTIRGSRLRAHEYSLGGTPWQLPAHYIDNSPVMLANKITTPLLILHCMNDTAVPWEQAVELFVALRRLNKKVWMLQYDNGSHSLWGQDAVDFTIRITQFFDHYLKGTPAPVWMTRGIPAKLKGVITGYELDESGVQP